MLFSCPCGVTISIPTWQFFSASGAELNYLCLQYDYSVVSNNPWIDAVLINGEAVAIRVTEEAEDEDIDEKEADDYIGAVIEYDEDNQDGHDESPEYYEDGD